MEDRRMTPRHAAAALVVVVMAAAAVFHLKYLVVGLERQLVELQDQIEAERWLLKTRRADFAYLTRPDRLALQADQLGLRPAQAAQIVNIELIGNRSSVELARNPLPVTLPSGADGALRAKPISQLWDVSRMRP
jgi:hypothetical protein